MEEPEMTAHNLRDLFLLDPEVVFLNHGSFGACPRPVFETYQDYQLQLEHQPVEFLGRRFTDLMQEARARLAGFIGAEANDLVYVPNATTGLNIAIRSLPLGPGDEVLTTSHEYGALDRTFRFICGKRGSYYIRRPLPLPIGSAKRAIDAVWNGVAPETKVLFLSHITSPTAITLPIAELIQRARNAGIITVVDGAHAPGQIPLDLQDLGADIYSGNCHKWLMAPKGSAFLYVRREIQDTIEPLVVSWGWESEEPGPSRFVDYHEWQGTRDIASFLAVPAAIQFFEDHDWPCVQNQCHELVRYARQRITALTGLAPITPDSAEWFAQMAAFPLPECDGVKLKDQLYDRYRIEVPITTLGDRNFVRISVQGYNTQSDLDILIAALGELL
jgi:isopenicillin-N epimerase